MPWSEPIRISALLEGCLDLHGGPQWPPEDRGAYVVSHGPWPDGYPGRETRPLYVGGTTGKSKRFRTRIGDLIADLHGFYGGETGHHSGGIKLHRDYCQKHRIKPGDLHIGWYTEPDFCSRCVERSLFEELKAQVESQGLVLLNKNAPPACRAGHLPRPSGWWRV